MVPVFHAIVLSSLHLSRKIFLLPSIDWIVTNYIDTHGLITSFNFWWINLPDLGAKFPTLKIYRKLFDLAQPITTCLGVLKEASDVSISIFVELFRTVLELCKYFDIYGLQSFARLFGSYLEFTVRFLNAYLDIARVERPKVLLVLTKHLNY